VVAPTTLETGRARAAWPGWVAQARRSPHGPVGSLGAVRSLPTGPIPPTSVVTRLVVWGAVASVAVASCSSAHHQASAPPAQETVRPGGPASSATAPSHTPPPASTAPSTTAQASSPPVGTIAWSACTGHAGWDCGALEVPLDHALPGRSISIALNRHRAAPSAARVGSLLVNPGGPGASGIDFAYDAVASILDPRLVQAFDVIGFDPRGVGLSTPVQCVDGPTLDRLNNLPPAPTTPAEVSEVVAGAKEIAAGCEANSGYLLPHIATVDAARDIDDIRSALGDPKLTYLGFSYGTLLGATYASLYPTHIRALVLDSAIDPTLDDAAMSEAQAVGFEQNLNAFLADCTAKGSGCPFGLNGSPSLRSAFDALMARIGAHPIPAGGGRTLGAGEAVYGVALPLYEQASWPALAKGLADAEQGSGATLLSFNDAYTERRSNGTYANVLQANLAINCVDHPSPSGPDEFGALAEVASRQAPFFGAPVAWGAIPCAYWPVPPVTHPGPLQAPGAPPILVTGSTGDPATPYPWARHLASELGSGVLLTRHGQGHGGYPASACVRAVEDDYLLALTVPPPAALDCPS